MIELKNSATQTIQPGQAISFDTVLLRSGCAECYNRQLPTSVKLKGGCGSVYELHFNGNITSEAAGDALQLAMAVSGSALTETAMNAAPAAAGTLVNVSTSTLLKLCCSDLNRVSVINTGTTPIVVAQNSNFYIKRVA